LGVTEAGEGEDGRLKSAVGIGALLQDGIGDTIRVSLSEKPENEIPVAKELRDYIYNPQSSRYVFPQFFIDSDSIIYQSDEPTDWSTFSLHAATDLGKYLFDNSPKALTIKNHHFTEQQLHNLSNDIMQAAGLIRYKTEFVSCPGCGRTLFDLQRTVAEIKDAMRNTPFKPLKIAVMGCIVNGPGEMADADYGYVGAGRGKISLYKQKECVAKNIPEEEAVERLLQLIAEHENK
jgi:(E)-4-hydroxy-3-methylbut-2-enyl-diphosphate synthase